MRAVLFPGQGSQEIGMGRDIAERDNEAMALWKRTEKLCQASLREIYWDGDEQAMAQTRYLQPALAVTGLSLWKACSHLRPDYLGGHSVGEFPALVAAGVLSAEEMLELVSLRGRLMFQAGESQAGKMAAVVKLDEAAVTEIVSEARSRSGGELVIANYNSPQQLVISGSPEAVDEAARLAKERKGRAMPLPVSGAFHSPLMEEAAAELARSMRKLSWSSAKVPLHLNATARPETDADRLQETMQRQMISPVYWTQIMNDQWDRGVRQWLELGPKGVLVGLLKHIFRGRKDSWQADCLDTAQKCDSLGRE
jgi:[acyl-carrier-protein] S-malonyltransferase